MASELPRIHGMQRSFSRFIHAGTEAAASLFLKTGNFILKPPMRTSTRKRSRIAPPARKRSGKKLRGAPAAPKMGAAGLLAAAPKSRFPAKLKPMLATLVDKPVEGPGWIYEVKWDGYRALAFSHKGKVELVSRNEKSFDKKFYPVHEAVKQLGLDAVLDGEIVVAGDTGISSFGGLQNWRSEADGELLYYVFDVLWLDGKDLTQLPLWQRKIILHSVIPPNGTVRFSKSFEEEGQEFFSIAAKLGLEGIIAKKAGGLYHPGKRTTEWLKIKANKRQEVVIGGYTNNEGSSKLFSALLVGVFENGELVYTGKIGTGFNVRTQQELMEKFKKLKTKKCPFSFVPDINKPSRFRPDPPQATATWLTPELVCEVSYAELTSDGVMRHPSFEGLRMDKNAHEVKLETETPAEEVLKQDKRIAEKKIVTPGGKKERRTLLNPSEETQVKIINGHELKFTNLSKIFWPKEKVTKRDVINYYYQAAPFILPYLKDRPQTLNRHPHGITGESFYQKDVTGKAPGWIETFLYHSEADERDKHFLVATDEASLLYMASLGCIELNPWSSRAQKPDHPDWCIIDLDPDKNPFEQVIKAAQVTKSVLDSLGVPAYCKTSGSTGLHIYIPLGAKYTYEQSKELGRAIVKLVHKEIPEFTSIERLTSKRKGKLYLDFLQNRPQATVAAPYSLRPKPGAPVSMPLHWDEVKSGLKMTDHNIFNAIARLKETGDLFKPVIGKGIDLEKVMKRFS